MSLLLTDRGGVRRGLARGVALAGIGGTLLLSGVAPVRAAQNRVPTHTAPDVSPRSIFDTLSRVASSLLASGLDESPKMANIPRATVQADANRAWSSTKPCMTSWMSTVATESAHKTLPRSASSFDVLGSIAREALRGVDLAADRPYVNDEVALVKEQLSHHELDAVNAERGRNMIKLTNELYANANVCRDAQTWSKDGSTSAEDPNSEQRFDQIEKDLGKPANEPIPTLNGNEKAKLSELEKKVDQREARQLSSVMGPIVKQIAALTSEYSAVAAG